MLSKFIEQDSGRPFVLGDNLILSKELLFKDRSYLEVDEGEEKFTHWFYLLRAMYYGISEWGLLILLHGA